MILDHAAVNALFFMIVDSSIFYYIIDIYSVMFL